MADNKITSTDKNFVCPECKNENTLSSEVNVGDIIECEFCGIEYEVTDKTEDGEFVLELIEEEK